MATKYYKVHGGRVTFAEYWRMAGNPIEFAIAAIAKLFGGLPMNFSIPLADELHTSEFEELPRKAQRALDDPVARLEDEGFSLAFCHELPLLETHRTGAAVVLLGPDPRVWAMAAFAHDKAMTQLSVSCITKYDDDVLRGVTTEKKQLQPHPNHVAVRMPGATADAVYRTHLAHMPDWECDANPVRMTPDSLAAEILALERQTVEYHAERGVFIPMTPDEVRRIRDENSDDDEDDY